MNIYKRKTLLRELYQELNSLASAALDYYADRPAEMSTRLMRELQQCLSATSDKLLKTPEVIKYATVDRQKALEYIEQIIELDRSFYSIDCGVISPWPGKEDGKTLDYYLADLRDTYMADLREIEAAISAGEPYDEDGDVAWLLKIGGIK